MHTKTLHLLTGDFTKGICKNVIINGFGKVNTGIGEDGIFMDVGFYQVLFLIKITNKS